MRPPQFQPLITAQAIPGQTGAVLMARIRGAGYILVTKASFAAAAYTVTDLSLVPPAVQYYQQTLVVGNVIYDALVQTDQTWSKDGPLTPGIDGAWGYNFMMVVPAAYLLNSGDRYQVDVLFTPVQGQPFRVPFVFQTLTVYG